MSEKLQQAIAATRAGQKRNAQLLLTEELQANPDNEHAWFLLGNLVDSPEKRMAYLGKALTLNPQYEKAKQQLAQIQRQIILLPDLSESTSDEEEPILIATPADDNAAQPTALPDWLEEGIEEEIETEAPEVTITLAEDKPQAVAATKSQAMTAAPATKPGVQLAREQQIKRYNYYLLTIIVFIIIVLIFLLRSL